MNKISKYRTLSLKNIYLPVSVNHGHLSPESRIDDETSRIDILLINVAIEYQWKDTSVKTLSGVFNYGKIYNTLCLGKMREISGPLECVLDLVLNEIELSAKEQGLVIYEASVTAQRKGLSVGSPVLKSMRKYQLSYLENDTHGNENNLKLSSKDSVKIRSAGIENSPLVVQVSHEWCKGDERVEHVDQRIEQVAIDFNAETMGNALSEGLDGLYNYASLVHVIQRMHNTTIDGPIEMLADMVTEKMHELAKKDGVNVLKTNVFVSRTGYARCTPVVGTHFR